MSGQEKRNKQLILTIFLAQIVIVLLGSALLWLVNGQNWQALSLLLGGMANILVQTYASIRMLSGGRFQDGGAMLKNLMMAEMIKFVLAITLLLLLLKTVDGLIAVWVVIGFILAQIMASISPLFMKRLYSDR